jgi:cyclopropane fatty-acyl-phospholipid synthase-like methyltransferase
MDDLRSKIKKETYFDLRGVSAVKSRNPDSLPPAYIIRELPANKQAPVLDIGCGFGGLVEQCLNLGYINTKGIDINEKSIRFCQELGLPVELVTSISDFANKNKTRYEMIFMTHVLEHIEKKEIIPILKTIHDSLLSEGGKIYIATPNAQASSGAYWAYEDFTHEVIFTSGSLRYVLEGAGFERVRFVDIEAVENSRFKWIKLFFLKLYGLNNRFWQKITNASYHPESPVIFSWELKAVAKK